MKKIIIEVREEGTELNFFSNNKEIESILLDKNANVGDRILSEIDLMLKRNRLKLKEIDFFEAKSAISDNYTAVKMAYLTAETLNFVKNVD
ncbi:MAG: hypothetical protein V3574_00540 [Candidatus Moraniibacteriota bacterium]